MSSRGPRAEEPSAAGERVELPSEELLSRRFHLVTGKGGVGKSTVAMTLGLTLAARGKRVLICEVDERDQLAHSFAVAPSQGELRSLDLEGVSGELWGVNMQLSSALSEYGELKLKVRALSQLLTENPLTKALISVIPGVGDLIYLGKAFNHERERSRAGEPLWDAVILDAPATGHGLTFLGLPKLIGELVPIGNLKRESDEMWALLSDPSRCALHVVTRPEELPTQEAFELSEQLQAELGLRVDVFWSNLVTPRLKLNALQGALDAQVERGPSWRALSEALSALTVRLSVEREAREQLAQHAAQLKTPVATLPRLTPTSGPRPIVDALLTSLGGAPPASELSGGERGAQRASYASLRVSELISGPTTKLITLVGGGGVGKTTVSAGLALALARSGARVALITIDPAKRLAQALGLSELSGTLGPVPLHPQLEAMMLERSVTALRLVARYASSPEVAERLSAHPYFKAFRGSMAGAQEYMALHEVSRALDSGRYDVVVLDTPPGRHALDFLDAPARLSRAVQSPALSLFAKASGGRVAGSFSAGLVFKAFGKLTSSAFVSDLTTFLSLFMDILRGLERAGVRLIERCERGDFILVSTPDELPLRVAEQARCALEARGMRAEALIINRASPLSAAQLEELRGQLEGEALDQLQALLALIEGERRQAARASRALDKEHAALASLSRLYAPELVGESSAARVRALSEHFLSERSLSEQC